MWGWVSVGGRVGGEWTCRECTCDPHHCCYQQASMLDSPEDRAESTHKGNVQEAVLVMLP